jgi:hypothetical protein
LYILTRVWEDEEEEDNNHDWKLWKRVTRSSGKPWDWSSESEHSEIRAAYEGGIAPSGKIDPLRNEKRNSGWSGSWYCRSTGPQRKEREREDFIGFRSGRAHIRRERWQWLENHHRNPEKKTKGNTETRKKKDVASIVLGRKGTVINR